MNTTFSHTATKDENESIKTHTQIELKNMINNTFLKKN